MLHSKKIFKYSVLMMFFVMSEIACADVKTELKEISRDLLINCKSEKDYRPIMHLNNFLKDTKKTNINEFDLMFIFNSDFLPFIENRSCSLSASNFSSKGIVIKEKYFKINQRTKFYENEVYAYGGNANLIEYSWTLDENKLLQSQNDFTQYLDYQEITINEKKECGKLCSDYIFLKNKQKYYLPLDYVRVLMSYHELFKHHYRNSSKSKKLIKEMFELFDLVDHLEIEYIKKTSLNSFPYEVASIENFKYIFKVGDDEIINQFYKKLDSYIQYRLKNNILDERMIKNLYEILDKESNYKNPKIEYLGTQNVKNKSISSYQLGNHIYKFNVEGKKLTLTMD